MTCFLWWVTRWQPKGPAKIDSSSPWWFSKRKNAFGTNWKQVQLRKEKYMSSPENQCKTEGTQEITSVWGLTFLSNCQIVTSNNKTFHTSYRISVVDFTRRCLGLGTCSWKSLGMKKSLYMLQNFLGVLVHVFVTMWSIGVHSYIHTQPYTTKIQGMQC